MSGIFINYAHRGASEYAPENTMSAFRLGLEQGANGIETDVQMTKDGVLVLFHDDKLERVTNASGAVGDYTLKELEKIDILGQYPGMTPDKIVTFEAFLDFAANKNVNLAIEIKQAGIEDEIIEMMSRYDILDRTIVTSFHFSAIEKFSRETEYKVGYLLRELNDEVIAQLKSIGGYQICPNVKDVTVESVKMLKEQGFSVRAWGIKTEEDMRRAFGSGVDGMTVNFPDKLRALMAMSGSV